MFARSQRRRWLVIRSSLDGRYRILDSWRGELPTPFKRFSQARKVARRYARRWWHSQHEGKMA